AVGSKVTNKMDIPELEHRVTQRLVNILGQQIFFLTFSATEGDAVLHFVLNSREEQGEQGDGREIDLFISLDGTTVEQGGKVDPGGKAFWTYREGAQHSDPVGSVDDVVEKIANCAQRTANFERLVRNVLSHVKVGQGGVLQVLPSSPELRWIFPFGPSEMCVSLNDTTFKVVNVGQVQDTRLTARAFVVAASTYA